MTKIIYFVARVMDQEAGTLAPNGLDQPFVDFNTARDAAREQTIKANQPHAVCQTLGIFFPTHGADFVECFEKLPTAPEVARPTPIRGK